MQRLTATLAALAVLAATPLVAQEDGRLNRMIEKLEAGEAVQGVF